MDVPVVYGSHTRSDGPGRRLRQRLIGRQRQREESRGEDRNRRKGKSKIDSEDR